MVGEHDKDKEHLQAHGGNREEVDGDQLADVVGEECSPGLGRRGVPLRQQTGNGTLGHLNPKLLQLAVDSRCALIWRLMGGRPTGGRPESLVQCSRKRRRCQRRTVPGVTMTRGCFHPAQTLASPAQKRRSVLRSRGRVIVRL